jgi:putative GTP pyrophosphokinase
VGADTDRWVSQYERQRPLYECFTKKLGPLLRDLLTREHISFHIINGRTKTVNSFRKKIARPDKQYSNPLVQVTDFSGIRIVLYYLDDVERVAKIVQNEFLVDQANSIDKGSLLKPQEFGYRSVQFIVSLSESRRILPEWNKFELLKAEIQIRTVLQHAWSTIDHKLRYKKEIDVPYQLRRRLFRLAGILELADEEFLSIRKGQERVKEEFFTMMSDQPSMVRIDLVTMQEYFRSSPTVKRVISSAEILGTKRIQIDKPTSHDFSLLIGYCIRANISYIKQLEQFIVECLPRANRFFDKIFDEKFYLSPPYLVTYLVLAKNPDILLGEQREQKHSWNPAFLSSILRNSFLLDNSVQGKT